MEQREIKVCLVHRLFAPHIFMFLFLCCFPLCVYFLCSVYFQCLSLPYISFDYSLFDVHTSIFFFSSLYSVFTVSHHTARPFPVFSFNSFLSALMVGCHLPISPLSISISIPSSPSIFSSSSLQFISLVSTQQGRTFLLLSHSARLLTHAVDC